jgi:hypothetical protein
MKKFWYNCLFLIIPFGTTSPLHCQNSPSHSGISVVSYLLRDRAVIIDSLEMRKCMYVAFKTSHSLSEIRSCAVVGMLSHQGAIMARDTTWIIDEPAGNLGFNLPYKIPYGLYKLEIKIINPAGKILDTFTDEYDRGDLKPYFNREINYWDFTTPYSHLECSGYGRITYHFKSNKTISSLKKVEISARMNSDNNLPALAEVLLNGTSLGKFVLPTGSDEKSIVNALFENAGIIKGLTIRPGENQLTFVIEPEPGFEGMGLRIYSHKNSPDPSISPEKPIMLTITGTSPAEKEEFSIPVWGEEGEHITSKFSIPGPKSFNQIAPEIGNNNLNLKPEDVDRGYVLFNRDFQRYVFPWTIPDEKDRILTLGIRMSRNDFDPVTLCIYPIRDLGEVKVSVSNLTGPAGNIIPAGNILIQVVRNLKVRTGEGNTYQIIPRLLDRTDHAGIPIAYTTRFWFTVHADSLTTPGKYQGVIRIQPQREAETILPFTAEVLPVTLEPVPGIDYSMCMSYEFFELESKEWSSAQKEKIYQDGVNSFRDYINHGMSTVAVASPYYFQWNKNGTPRLEHLNAMIRAAKETGFTRPVFWYYGQYLQAAKGQHPGNIRLYDPKIHPARARFLAETALKLDKALGGPPLGFMPIDEPRIALRQKITLELFKEIKKVPGTKIMCTTNIGGKLLDIENDSQVDRKNLGPGEKVRKSDRKVWEYNNAVVECLNPGYSRYIYGYYTWRQDLDGMNSWGPGTTENSRGNPYEDLDHELTDYALTYPHVGGPLATPNWEALREGIDDIRYVYQLEKLCSVMAVKKPAETAKALKFLDSIRDLCDFDDRNIINEFGDWTPERYESLRNQVIEWILTLEN